MHITIKHIYNFNFQMFLVSPSSGSFVLVLLCSLNFRYKNRPNMTFDDTGAEPEQTFEMHPDPNGVMEYATKSVFMMSDSYSV